MRRWLTFYRDLGLQLLAFYLFLIIPFLVTLLVFDRLVGERIRGDVEANDIFAKFFEVAHNNPFLLRVMAMLL